MSTEIQIAQQEQIQLIKQMYAKDTTDTELQHFLYVCKKTGLNPLTRQIYLIKRKGQITIQTGIDGFRSIAERTGEYMASDQEPIFCYDGNDALFSCTLFVKRYHSASGTWHNIASKAFFKEYVPYVNDYDKQGRIIGKKYSEMWLKMPHTMIAKCAEALALRKAFPEQLGGLYTQDEMMQADMHTVQESNQEVAELREPPKAGSNPRVPPEEVKQDVQPISEQERVKEWRAAMTHDLLRNDIDELMTHPAVDFEQLAWWKKNRAMSDTEKLRAVKTRLAVKIAQYEKAANASMFGGDDVQDFSAFAD